jgi:hypothetical protein
MTIHKYKKRTHRTRTVTEEIVSVGSKQYHKFLQSRDKYIKLASEARACDDRVAEQNYLQFADHYNRQIQFATAHTENENLQQEDVINEKQTYEAVLIFNEGNREEASSKGDVNNAVNEELEELV